MSKTWQVSVRPSDFFQIVLSFDAPRRGHLVARESDDFKIRAEPRNGRPSGKLQHGVCPERLGA